MPHKIKKIMILSGDIAFFYLSLYLALLVRYGKLPTNELWYNHLPSFSFLLLIWVVVFYIFGLYSFHSLGGRNFFKNTLQSFLASILLAIIFFYLSSTENITPKTNLLIFSISYFVIFTAWRKTLYFLMKSYLPKTRVAIIGLSRQSENLIREIKNKPYLGYEVIFILDNKASGNNFENTPVFNDLGKLKELVAKKKINTIILPENVQNSESLRSTLFSCLPLKVNYSTLSNFYENITGKIPVSVINQMWFLENLNEGNKNGFDSLKRLYDFILSFILLVITLPLWLLIAVFIKLDSKGGVFFKQKRMGKNKKSFTIIKFRTMKTENNDHSLTREKDDRITRVGKILRKTRLDELPQLINILKGEMSFVGPRPERPVFIEKLEKDIPFYKERMLIKPGITGWDQISGEYHSPTYEDTLKKLQYDLFYIKNRSIYMDLSIFLKTIATVLSKNGR